MSNCQFRESKGILTVKVYRIFCDICGLDTYVTSHNKPLKCPSCGDEETFMAASEPECEEAELAFYAHIEDEVEESNTPYNPNFHRCDDCEYLERLIKQGKASHMPNKCYPAGGTKCRYLKTAKEIRGNS